MAISNINERILNLNLKKNNTIDIKTLYNDYSSLNTKNSFNITYNETVVNVIMKYMHFAKEKHEKVNNNKVVIYNDDFYIKLYEFKDLKNLEEFKIYVTIKNIISSSFTLILKLCKSLLNNNNTIFKFFSKNKILIDDTMNMSIEFNKEYEIGAIYFKYMFLYICEVDIKEYNELYKYITSNCSSDIKDDITLFKKITIEHFYKELHSSYISDMSNLNDYNSASLTSTYIILDLIREYPQNLYLYDLINMLFTYQKQLFALFINSITECKCKSNIIIIIQKLLYNIQYNIDI